MNEPAYYEGCNRELLAAVPVEALRFLDLGCGAGRLGEALKLDRPDRIVVGIEREQEIASLASSLLDRVLALDLEKDAIPDDLGDFDCILFGDVLEHQVEPLSVLARTVPRLAQGGCVLCSIPNAQHHSVVEALLTGEFQYQQAGLLDATHLRFFTLSTAFKLFLDAGLEPDLVGTIRVACPPGWLQAAYPLLDRFRLDHRRLADRLDAYQYILRGRPMSPVAVYPGKVEGLTIVTCVTDPAQLQANLLASPDLAAGCPHEILAYQNCPAAADAINRALEVGKHRLCLFAHQDVYLPRGWFARFLARYGEAEQALGPIGVCGVYGAGRQEDRPFRAGRVVDRDRLLTEPAGLPCRVEALDEMLLVIPRPSTRRANSDLGFHLYGADLAQQARRSGLAAAVVDAPCLHNSRSLGLPPDFARSVHVFLKRWADALPVMTPCALITPQGFSPC